MRLRTRLIALTVAVAAGLAALAAGAAISPSVFFAEPAAAATSGTYFTTFNTYRWGFSPANSNAPSGVHIRFLNRDSIPHRVVSYDVGWSEPWSLDITLAPGESYFHGEPFICEFSGCRSGAYLFRDPDRSTLVNTNGWVYCSGYCGRLWVGN